MARCSTGTDSVSRGVLVSLDYAVTDQKLIRTANCTWRGEAARWNCP
jgi:hypothetical protein